MNRGGLLKDVSLREAWHRGGVAPEPLCLLVYFTPSRFFGDQIGSSLTMSDIVCWSVSAPRRSVDGATVLGVAASYITSGNVTNTFV